MRVPALRTRPAPGFEVTTRPGRTRLVVAFVTLPTRQCAWRSRVLAARNVRPASFGTRQTTGLAAGTAGAAAAGAVRLTVGTSAAAAATGATGRVTVRSAVAVKPIAFDTRALTVFVPTASGTSALQLPSPASCAATPLTVTAVVPSGDEAVPVTCAAASLMDAPAAGASIEIAGGSTATSAS